MRDDDDSHLLARIDERVRHMEHMIAEFVRHQEFRPVQLIAFGMVALLLSSLVAAIVAQVVK
jgi:hypothetical protein